MAIKRLPIEKQIEVLKKAKDSYVMDEVNNSSSVRGMCYHIDNQLIDLGLKTGCYNLKPFIPSFSRTNMLRLAKRGLIEKPRKDGAYFWTPFDKTIRPIVFDVLISELEKELV